MSEVTEKREKGETLVEELIKAGKEIGKEERWKRIRESNYNKWYKWIKGDGIPEYLKKGWGESRCRRLARFRLGNEMRAGQYWKEEEERKCRICGKEEETWEHVWEKCRDWRGQERGGWMER
ncbi:hypothetical protein X777_06867 [Ooceraea biroi]|uniref:Uncharacterized protein n=1 Tax=Ooceraea biroi TaxID=2015173 RepID=A0A026WCY1_OOCBI|nr:hypothetical protein X777_06867 [Ooceraea biroi]